jgi:hypothetical protein
MRKYYLEIFNIYFLSNLSFTLAILSPAMLRENHAVFLGKKYRFPRGGGGNKYPFSTKI